jgi:hypothetical protein
MRTIEIDEEVYDELWMHAKEGTPFASENDVLRSILSLATKPKGMAEDERRQPRSRPKSPLSGEKTAHSPRANFSQACIDVVNAVRGLQLRRCGRILYGYEKITGAVCRVANEAHDDEGIYYFFTLHQSDWNKLRPYSKRYVVLGCGSGAQTLQIPLETFEPWIAPRLDIYVRRKGNRFLLHRKALEFRDEKGIQVTDDLLKAAKGHG